jgi:hypothetical protein
MGKTPGFAMVGFCWLGLALAGCDTVNSNNTSPKQKFQATSTFGNNNKDAAVAKTPAPADPALAQQGRPVGTAAGASGIGSTGGTLPEGTIPGAIRQTGQRTPGDAGLIGTAPAGLNYRTTISDDKKTTPFPGSDDGLTGPAISTSRAPQSAAPTAIALPAPPQGVDAAMQLPPSAQQGTPLAPVQGGARPSIRQTSTLQPSDSLNPPTAPELPAGTRQMEAPPVVNPPEEQVHNVPAPAAPVPPAPAPIVDAAPPPPPAPFIPGNPNP